MKVNVKKVKIFRIKNRKGYAAICLNHLTEGKTIIQVYQRMIKALKRSKIVLDKLDAKKVSKLIKNL